MPVDLFENSGPRDLFEEVGPMDLFDADADIQPVKALKEGSKELARSTLQFFKGSEEARDVEKEASRFGVSGKAGPLQSLMTDQMRQDVINARSQGKTDAEGLEAGRQAMINDFQSAIDSKLLKPDKTLKRPEGFRGYVQDVIKMAPQIGAQVATTMTTGPAGGMAFMATQIAGSHYQRLVDDGEQPERAFKASLADAVMQAPMEQVGMAKAFNVWKPQRLIGKRIQAAAEAGFVGWLTETLQKYPELAADIWAKGEGLSNKERIGQFLDGAWDAFKEGAYEGAVAAPFEALIGSATVQKSETKKTDEQEEPNESRELFKGKGKTGEELGEEAAMIGRAGAEYFSSDRRKMPRGEDRRSDIAQRQEMENWTPEQIAGFRNAKENIIKTVKSEVGSSEAFNDLVNKGAELVSNIPEARNKAMEAMERPLNEVIYWVADKNRPLESVQKKLNKVTEDIDVFLKETQRPKVVAAQVKKVWDEDVKPLIEETAKRKKTLEQVEDYSHAMHAHEANKSLRIQNSKRYYEEAVQILDGESKAEAQLAVMDVREPIQWSIALERAFERYPELSELKDQWDKFSEKPSGMSDAEADKILEKYDGDADMEHLRKMLSEINNKQLDILNEAGLIPKEEYEIIKNKYDFYVPLRREGYSDALYGSSRGLQPSGKPIKARAGSSRQVVNIVANSVANLEKAINMAEKARSTRALYDLVKQNPNPDFWRIKEVKKSPRHDSDGNIRMYPNMFDVADNEFRFMVDGKQHILEVNRDNRDAMLMIKTFKSDDASMGWVLNQFSRLNRILARVNTSWSPEFIISNLARDFQTAGININDTGVKGKQFFSGTKDAIRAIWRVERGKQKGTEYEQLYERFKAAGGKIGWSDVHQSVENLSKKITREIDMAAGKRKIRKTVKEWGDFVEAANTSVENGVRLHVFKLALEQGKSDARAAQIASDITVDFTKKGAAGPVINSLYLFANSGIQGPYRIFRAGAKSKKVRRIMAGIIGAGFLNGLLNGSAGEGDDGEDYFNNMLQSDPYVADRNAIFMLPGTEGKYAKIPLPWGYNFFWNIGVEASRAFTKEDYDYMNGAGRLTSIFFDAFNPVASGTLLQTILPTIADPIAKVYENKDWHGGPLMPEQDKFAKVPTPDSQRFWSSARPTSIAVARELNKLTGGDKVKSGKRDVSPETIDMLIDTAGGSALRFFVDIKAVSEKAIKQEKIELREIPFARKVAGEQSEWSNSKIYNENLRKVLTAEERLKVYRGTPEYQEIFDETKKQRKMFNSAKATEKRLRKLRKQLKSAKNRDDKKQQENIKERMEKLYINFNRMYNKK